MVVKYRYRINEVFSSTPADLVMLAPDAGEHLKVLRVILELEVIPHLANMTANIQHTYAINLHKKINNVSVVDTITSVATADLGPIPEEDIWRFLGGNRMHTEIGIVPNTVIYRDFKTSRNIEADNSLVLSLTSSTTQTHGLVGFVTLIVTSN